ncbi:REC114 meiotic recombination protein [Phyllostomus discolor]|uniref:Meiotic recombination protein REC114 isoform X2 n=1 Tax=Phyllostomus discolor TaxID=89673 RepID=A0A6J2LCV4_9CHIR|nr:meiotic recombination protein REC114 isoform X2 [Phyllostomus discolor]KAF6132537.1 REC114 meiotic recombination protein [Phyllostomus discolor]
MAEAGKKGAGLGLPHGDAAQWPLQRYGRFVLLGAGEPPAPGLDAGMASSPTWKVFDSSEESGYLILTIVISGHFFISQGQTLLDKSRMFRVQFGGESKQQALERCDSCVRSLAQYVTIQTPEGSSPGPRLCQGPLPAADSRMEGCVRSVPLLLPPPGSHQELGQQRCVPAVTGTAGGRTSVTQLAQSLLASEELPLVYEQSAWNSEELGPFLRLCLLDQSFPAFVEQVEKELIKLTGFRN